MKLNENSVFGILIVMFGIIAIIGIIYTSDEENQNGIYIYNSINSKSLSIQNIETKEFRVINKHLDLYNNISAFNLKDTLVIEGSNVAKY